MSESALNRSDGEEVTIGSPRASQTLESELRSQDKKSRKSVRLSDTPIFEKDNPTVPSQKSLLKSPRETATSQRISTESRKSKKSADQIIVNPESQSQRSLLDETAAKPLSEMISTTSESQIIPQVKSQITSPITNQIPRPSKERSSFGSGRRQVQPPPRRGLEVLETLKEQVVSFQEKRGVPRDGYTYTAVVTCIVNQAYKAICQVLFLLLAVAPLTEITVHIARFTLERLCEIGRTTDHQKAVVQTTIFGIQFLSLLVIVTFVFGAILVPITMMTKAMICKIFNAILIW